MYKKILLVSLNSENSLILESILLECNYSIDHSLPVNDKVLESIHVLKPDLIIIYVEEPQDTILQTIRMVQEKAPTPIIIFADHCKDKLIGRAINAGASGFIVDGIVRHRIVPIIEAATARFIKCQTMKMKLIETEIKLIDRRDINRAKGILMKNKNIGEDEAYEFLCRLAMNRNLPVGEFSRAYISASSLLQ